MADRDRRWNLLEISTFDAERALMGPGQYDFDLSQAISLKRIADALEKLAAPKITGQSFEEYLGMGEDNADPS